MRSWLPTALLDGMKTYDDVTELIGRTPLLRLGRVAPEARLYGKCEFLNPMSIKDRPVKQILADAAAEGRLSPGDTVIECTSGNTGMAVAFIASVLGYRAILVMSEIQSVERRQVMRALGAELVLTPASEGTKGAKARLLQICEEHPDYFYVGQHQSPSNARAHELTTGPELWDDTDGGIDVLVAGLGTGGTLCGASRFLKPRKPSVRIIGVEPAEAPYLSQGKWQPHRLMGTAPGFTPETYDPEQVDEIELASEDEAFEMCRRLAREEGILVGISSGAAVAAALRVAGRPELEDALIVAVLCDSGQRYLSVDGLFEA